MVTLTAAVLELVLIVAASPPAAEPSSACIECHRRELVAASSLQAWQDSRHASAGVACADCHLSDPSHQLLSLCPAPGVQRRVSVATCGGCHPAQATSFEAGGHALAWLALEQARRSIGGDAAAPAATRGCENCHRIGQDGGRCDYCHTRHSFSPAEARRPEACRPCHQGSDHPEWEMYSLSRHGSIYATEGGGWDWSAPLARLFGGPETGGHGAPRAPVCATCHMPAGRHGVTATGDPLLLGFAADDADWAADEAAIRRHFTACGEAMVAAEVLPAATGAESATTAAAADDLAAAVTACGGCHTRSWAASRLAEAHQTVREVDRLVATAVRIVDAQQAAGRIPRPTMVPCSADLLGLVDPGSPLEERLWSMVLVHRPQLVLGTFHHNPDFQQRQGWRELRADLAAIEAAARAQH